MQRFKEYLDNFAPIENFKKLNARVAAKSTNQSTSNLQLASQYGRLDVAAWLLNAGAEVEVPEGYVSAHHPLLAKFLISCGANHLAYHLKPDPIVTDAIFFRAICQKESGLVDLCLPNLKSPHDFMELAEDKKDEETLQKLRKMSLEVNKTMYFPPEEKKHSPADVKNEFRGYDSKRNNAEHEVYPLLMQAFAERNYLTLATIIDAYPSLELLKILLENKQKEAALFLVVAMGMDVFECALLLRGESYFDDFIQLTWNKEGLLTHLIDRSIIQDRLPPVAVTALLTSFAEQSSSQLVFEHCLNRRYKDLHFNWRNPSNLSAKNSDLISGLGKRFNLSVLNDVKNPEEGFAILPQELLGLVIQYIGIEENDRLERIANISQPLLDRVLSVYPHFRPYQVELNLLKDEFALLQSFVTIATDEPPIITSRIERAPFTKIEKITMCIGFLIVLGGLGVGTYYNLEYNDLKNQMKNLRNGDRSCWDASEDAIACPKTVLASACLDLCLRCFDAESGFVIPFSVGPALLVGCIVLLLFAKLSCPTTTQHLSLSSYSNATKRSADALLNGYQEFESNPFRNSTMESKLIDVLAIASNRLREVTEEIQRLEKRDNVREHVITIANTSQMGMFADPNRGEGSAVGQNDLRTPLLAEHESTSAIMNL